jgi:protein phosphatase
VASVKRNRRRGQAIAICSGQETAMPPELVLTASGSTDLGRVRTNNEDAILVRGDLSLYLVADGAGGHASGEIASQLAVRSIENFFAATREAAAKTPEFDRFGIRAARGACRKPCSRPTATSSRSRRPSRRSAAWARPWWSPRFHSDSGLLHVAHVGDSRCYRLRGGHLELMTQDHSLLTDVVEQRPDLPDDVLERLPKNIVTRALGMNASLRVSLRSHAVVAERQVPALQATA